MNNPFIYFSFLALTIFSCNKQESLTPEQYNINNMKTQVEWKHSTNIYEVNVRQYTLEGTFKAFQAHLPRLKEMGVETLWFMPITPIAQKNKKGTLGSQYAAQDYTAINPEFGTLEDFKTLVQEAHKMGFKVIIDWVANHTGWDHKWTKTHPEFYLKDPRTGDFQIASGMEDIIELDYSNPKMREAMIDAMRFWIKETNIDGFRCDLASWVEVDFWQQARAELDAVKPLFWLGEFDELENPDYGKVFDASYVWTWMHKTEDYNKGNTSFEDLKNLLQKYTEIGNTSMRAWFTSNHDENTWNGTEYEKYSELAKPLAVFSITWNGIPLIYNGQELPLYNKRLQFFEKDNILWADTPELHQFYKILLNLKSKNPALRGGDDAVSTRILKTSADDKVLAYLRKNGENEVFTIINFSKQSISVSVDDDYLTGDFRNVFTNTKRNFTANKTFQLSVSGYAVFER